MNKAYTQTYPRKKIVVNSVLYHGKCAECKVDYPFLARDYASKWINDHERSLPQHHVTYYETAAVID
jgi:hypothetical protein